MSRLTEETFANIFRRTQPAESKVEDKDFEKASGKEGTKIGVLFGTAVISDAFYHSLTVVVGKQQITRGLGGKKA